MFLKVGVYLPSGWQESISNRARFILENLGEKPEDDQTWFHLVEEVSKQTNGSFYTWLALTGCYPDKFELKDFVAEKQIYGLTASIQNLLAKRSKSSENIKFLVSIELVTPKFRHIVDVTHTYTAPYLTGIQRVVFGVTDGAKNISICVWVGDSGIMEERNVTEMKVAQNVSESLGWRLRFVHSLHALVPKLEKTRIGTQLRNALLPFARILKQRLVSKDVEKQLIVDDGKKYSNLLILNSVITIPEITSTLRQIYLYESILENEIVPLQIILYDFIPFFHAWTCEGARGHYNSYVRLVLLASRIISISSLVQEQAELITQAFRLERQEWSSRTQSYSFLPLPSGLKPTSRGEFQKQKNLVVMVGSLEPRKNHLQFLSVIEILAQNGVRVKARILGSAGWHNEQILAKIHSLQKRGIDIERIGKISDSEMRNLIAEAQVLLQISEGEGFGLPIAEALALGTKVIVSNIRPLNEWENERVSVVEIGNIEQLKIQLLNVLNNPENECVTPLEGVTWADWQQLLFAEKPTL